MHSIIPQDKKHIMVKCFLAIAASGGEPACRLARYNPGDPSMLGIPACGRQEFD